MREDTESQSWPDAAKELDLGCEAGAPGEKLRGKEPWLHPRSMSYRTRECAAEKNLKSVFALLRNFAF